MQVLRGLSFSDQAAVNLKLKEGAKAKVTVHGDIGTGYCESEHFLYLGELFTMTIKGNVQNITSLKLNNTGMPLGGTNTGFYGSNGGESLNQYISIGSVAAVNNRSATFSTSTNWKVPPRRTMARTGRLRLRPPVGRQQLGQDLLSPRGRSHHRRRPSRRQPHPQRLAHSQLRAQRENVLPKQQLDIQRVLGRYRY